MNLNYIKLKFCNFFELEQIIYEKNKLPIEYLRQLIYCLPCAFEILLTSFLPKKVLPFINLKQCKRFVTYLSQLRQIPEIINFQNELFGHHECFLLLAGKSFSFIIVFKTSSEQDAYMIKNASMIITIPVRYREYLHGLLKVSALVQSATQEVQVKIFINI